MEVQSIDNATPEDYRRFILVVGVTVLAILLPIISLNYLIDPCLLRSGITGRFFPVDFTYERELRYNLISIEHPSTLFMGASQVAIGIDPHDPSVSDHNAFNAAPNGGSLIEIVRLLSRAVEVGKVKHLILGVSYNMTTHPEAAYINDLFLRDDASPRAWFKNAEAFVSVQMLKSSVRVIINKISQAFPFMSDDGLVSKEFMEEQTRRHGGVRGAFDARNIPARGDLGLFDIQLRKIIAIACKAHAEVTIALLPDHAADLEIFALTNQWSLLKQWKRDVVTSATQSKCPTKVLDFEDYNLITTEPVPPAGADSRMEYYWDAGHFTTATGALMLKRIFGGDNSSATNDAAFGNVLDEKNIESSLRRFDDERLRYEKGHPGEVARVKALLRAPAAN